MTYPPFNNGERVSSAILSFYCPDEGLYFHSFFFRLGFATGSPVIEKGRVLSVFFSYRLAKEMILFELNFLIKVGFK